ncbi:TPA: HAD family phosphatase [Candidatus Woesearchaeota archaeon]|nr:HAD family phosphatase [Candidatus Woesearchaeota archaeon]
MIKIILFDLGEVFFVSNSRKLDESLKAKTGVSIKPKEGKHYQFYIDFVEGKLTIDEYFDKLRNAANIDISIDTLRKAYADSYKETSTIDYGMIELAKKLKKKYRLICITNTNLLHKNINKERGLYEVFERVFSSEEAKKLKNESWFSDILKELNVKSENCLFIDDLEENTLAARKVGIKSITFKGREDLIKEMKTYGLEI